MLPWYMSQPVKLSDVLVLDARLIGEVAERSIAGQIEYWANLGRAIDPLLQGIQALALCKKASALPLSECLETVDTPEGKARVKKYLETQPFPHYQQATEATGLLVRIEADGKRTIGRFVNRKFQLRKSQGLSERNSSSNERALYSRRSFRILSVIRSVFFKGQPGLDTT